VAMAHAKGSARVRRDNFFVYILENAKSGEGHDRISWAGPGTDKKNIPGHH